MTNSRIRTPEKAAKAADVMLRGVQRLLDRLDRFSGAEIVERMRRHATSPRVWGQDAPDNRPSQDPYRSGNPRLATGR